MEQGQPTRYLSDHLRRARSRTAASQPWPPPGRRMLRGWRCGAERTRRNMRAHFTVCAKRPAGSDDVERREGTLKVKRGRPAGQRMLCGWGCGPRTSELVALILG